MAVLVTGGCGYIGSATVAMLKDRGEVVVADLNNAGDPTGWLRAAEETLGPTDVLVNNAGMSYVEPTPGISAKRIEKIFQLNVHTPIASMHHVEAFVDQPVIAIMPPASMTRASPAPIPRPTATIRSPSISTSPFESAPMAGSIETTQRPGSKS